MQGTGVELAANIWENAISIWIWIQVLSYYNCTCKLDNGLSSSTLGDLLVIVGDVVDVKEAVSIVVNEENVLNRLLLLLENVMEPSEKN